MSSATAWLLPALRTLGLNLVDALREGSQQASVGGGRHRLRGALVVAEVALAVILVVGAGLMMRSLTALNRIDLGFNPGGVLTLRFPKRDRRRNVRQIPINTEGSGTQSAQQGAGQQGKEHAA